LARGGVERGGMGSIVEWPAPADRAKCAKNCAHLCVPAGPLKPRAGGRIVR